MVTTKKESWSSGSGSRWEDEENKRWQSTTEGMVVSKGVSTGPILCSTTSGSGSRQSEMRFEIEPPTEILTPARSTEIHGATINCRLFIFLVI